MSNASKKVIINDLEKHNLTSIFSCVFGVEDANAACRVREFNDHPIPFFAVTTGSYDSIYKIRLLIPEHRVLDTPDQLIDRL